MQLFSHNSNMLIPNLPHAKLYFQNGRQNNRYIPNYHDYTSCPGAQRTHKLDFRVRNNIFSFVEFRFLRPGQLSRKKSKMAANNTESTITFF